MEMTILDVDMRPDGTWVRLAAPPMLAAIAAAVMSGCDATQVTPDARPMPDDPLARLELQESMELVASRAGDIASGHAASTLQALRAWSQGEAVRVDADTVWAWSCAFNGVYASLRSSAIADQMGDYTPGAPAPMDLDAEFAALLGGESDQVPAAPQDAMGWDEMTILFAVLTSDCLELAPELG